ncbi:hypothetical protein IWW48_000064 [Coemansia sp. RSA 1200]|nr:hypothetical protein IWW48_000064 [Coemansia sp. RSA 1200]
MTPNSIEGTPTKPSASGLNSAPIDDLTAMLSQGSVRRQNSENKNRRSAASGHIRTTPMVQKVGTEIPIFVEESDRKLREKRSELAKQLAGRQSNLGLFELIESLEVSKEYLEFLDSSLDVFDGIAEHVPSLINNKLVAQPSGKALVNSKLSGESALMDYFLRLWKNMVSAIVHYNSCAPDKSTTKLPTFDYVLADHQNSFIPGSRKKADGVFYYHGSSAGFESVHTVIEAKIDGFPDAVLPELELGQISDYALSIWEKQPLRTFVPVFFLHGCNISLFMFTRDGCVRTNLGKICYSSTFADISEITTTATKDLCRTLQVLWFLLTLPSDKFGQCCRIPISMMRLGFKKQHGDNVLVTAAALDSLNGIRFKSEPMCTKARLIGRLAFIVQTVYDEKKAVVKFSWTPANRLSEGAAYDILHGANVPHIPMVYDSGILKKDVFGYRLEYIVMEDCGHELFDFGQKYYKHGRSSELCHVVSKHIAQVSSCLVRAQAAGLLHRDISSGNIAVNASKHASVIDWGYAKVFRSSEPGAWERTERILQKWHLDPVNTVEAEAYHDNMTGTPHYMSVQILLNNPKRGLIHDLESLFYVVLHALSDTASGTPPGFRLFDSHSLAAARIGFLTERDHFYKPFGVSVHERLRNVLDAMYCFLFTRNGQYIGGKLLYVEDFERDICKEHAEKFIDSDTLSLMMSVKECSLSTNEDMEVLTPPKRRHPDDDYGGADSPDNKHMRT